MANAMKKLKLLHHLTAATTTTSPLPPAAANAQFPTPPTSPVSPQTSTVRSHYQPHSYNDVLRSARVALHSLHNGQQSVGPPPAAPQPPTSQYKHQHHQQPCLLPSGFMVLTPNDPHPAICMPNDPLPQTPQQQYGLTPMNINPSIQQIPSSVPQGNRTIYSSRPPPHNSASASRHNSIHRHASKPRARLTREAVSKVSKDSRLARWERVVGYVREQRSSTLPQDEGIAWASYCYGSTSPTSPVDRKRRADEFAEIDRCVQNLDQIDREEQDKRSLWSGGSAGTDGVDEFVWSEDEADDDVPSWEAPPPKQLPKPQYVTSPAGNEEDGIFELDDEHVLGNPRPKSTPDRMDWDVIEDMPELRREGELEGGLAKIAGRRMSAVY